ncbi:DUF2512 family protein [Brevibacillus ginsengisoli]|uniref:DUF2512 family protein n=1 Tax=Brevibacillus ginsengisoli TaxID=363854 RepID=UPI003CEBE57D
MPLFARVAVNFLYKLIVFPSILYGGTLLFPEYVFWGSWLVIACLAGLFLVIGLVADETILPLFGNVKSTVMGFVFMTGVIWLVPLLFQPTCVTLMGALIVGGMLGLAELIMHQWILQQRKINLAG